jgi:hypothetical protein
MHSGGENLLVHGKRGLDTLGMFGITGLMMAWDIMNFFRFLVYTASVHLSFAIIAHLTINF